MELASRSDEEILAVVNPIMDNLMAASTDIDHARHVHDFTDRLKAIVTPERLQEMCHQYQKKWGYLDKREFVAIFRRSKSMNAASTLRRSTADSSSIGPESISLRVSSVKAQ